MPYITNDNHTSLKEKAVKSVFWLGGAKLLGQALTWILTIFLVRILTPEDFGLVGLEAVYQAVIIIIYDLNLGTALVQKSDLRDDDPSTCFWFIICFSFSLYVFTWFASPRLSVFFDNPSLTQVLRIYSIATLIDSLHIVPFWLLSRNFDFNKRAKAEFISNIFHSVIQLSLAFAGYGVWSLVFGYIVKYTVLCIMVFWYSQWVPKFTFHFDRLKELLRFSLPLTGAKLLKLISLRLDTVIIGRVFNITSLGYYNVAMDLSKIPQNKIMTIINQVAYPVFSRQNDNLPELRHYFLRLNFLLVLFLLPIYTGGMLLAEDLINILLSPKWSLIKLPFQTFCLLGILQCLNQYFFMILNARGKSSLNLKYNSIAVVVLPIGFLIGSNYGIEGVCLSWLITFPLLFCFILYITLHEIQLELHKYLKSMLHPFLGTIIMGAMVVTVKHQIMQISITGTVAMILTGIIMYLLYISIFSRHTFQLINDIIQTSGLLTKFRKLKN